MGSAWLDGVGLRDGDRLMAIVDRHPQVRAIVWGHVHQASDSTHGKVRLLSAPSTCAQFLPNNPYFALDDRPPGYRWLELHPDGSVKTSVAWLTAGR
jgi:Icc protein